MLFKRIINSSLDKTSIQDLLHDLNVKQSNYDIITPNIIDYSNRPYKDNHKTIVGVCYFNGEFKTRFGGWINYDPREKTTIYIATSNVKMQEIDNKLQEFYKLDEIVDYCYVVNAINELK